MKNFKANIHADGENSAGHEESNNEGGKLFYRSL